MKITKKILFLIAVVFVFQSCYYDVEQKLYPSSACDVTGVTLSSKVKPILQQQCYTCHSSANAAVRGAGINLETYAGTSCLQDYATNGKLSKSINHEAGVSAMPKGYSAKIDPCQIKIIDKWIADGSKND